MADADDPKRALLDALPDVPRWIQARALLGDAGSELYASPDGFVVSSRVAKLAVGVGQPPRHLFEQALAEYDAEWTVLAAPEDATGISAALPELESRHATLLVLSGPTPHLAEPDPDVVRLQSSALDRVPESLARQIARVIDTTPVLAIEVGGAIASVSFVPWETERLYDVSVDTLGPYRQHGYGERIARALFDGRDEVKRPVWRAAHPAALRLAARLGFRELDEIVVLSPKSGALTSTN